MSPDQGGLQDLDELYEEIILDHYRNPRLTDPIEDPDAEVAVNNPFCGDEIRLQVARGDDHLGRISVSGRGCAISQASGSLLASLIQGKTVAESQQIVKLVRDLLMGKELTEEQLDSLGDMAALAGVRKYPVRIKCALLSWSALEDALSKLAKQKK